MRVARLLALCPDRRPRPRRARVGPGDHRHHRRHRHRQRRRRARRDRHHAQRQPRHDHDVHDRRRRRLHGAVPRARHLCRRSRDAGLQEMGAQRHRAGSEPTGPRRCAARSRYARGDHHRGRDRAAAANGVVGGRRGGRGEGDSRAAAELAQLRVAGVPRARRHAWTGRREPLRCEHVQPARRVELQRARPSGQHQRLADRRHRQQRVHVQHRHHHAVGGVGARVQGADRRVLGRVRPRRRRGVGVDQVGQQRVPRHGVRVLPRREVRRAQLLRRQVAHACAQAAPGSQPVRRRHRRARSSATARSSSSTTRACARRAAWRSSTPCRPPRRGSATSRNYRDRTAT